MPKFDINDIRKLLGYGSQTAPKIIDDVAIEAGPLANRIPTEAVEVGPQVLGKGPRLADDVVEAVDTPFTEITPTTGMDDMRKRMDPRLAKIAASLGLVTGGAMMVDGEEPPMSPEALAKSSTPEAPVVAEPDKGMESRMASSLKTGMSAPAAPSVGVESEPDSSPTELPQSFEQELLGAQQGANQNTFYNQLLRAGVQAGTGLSTLGSGQQIKADYSGVDALAESAGQPVKDVTARFGAREKQQTFNKAKDELNDEAKMRDPNSEVSKLTTELAAKAGLIKPGTQMSAMALKNSGVNLGNLLSTIEAGKARKEAAQLQREAMSSSKATAREDKQTAAQKLLDDKRKLVLEEVEDRKQNIKDNIALVRDMVKESGTVELMGSHNEDLNRRIDAIAVDMAKLTDPKSVARPAEVEMFRKGLFGGGSQGMKLSNKSALSILDNFENEIESRARHAYKVRGFSQPNEDGTTVTTSGNKAAPAQETVERKTKDGKIAIFDKVTQQFIKYKD